MCLTDLRHKLKCGSAIQDAYFFGYKIVNFNLVKSHFINQQEFLSYQKLLKFS